MRVREAAGGRARNTTSAGGRVGWLVASAAGWGLTVWLALHRSAHPEKFNFYWTDLPLLVVAGGLAAVLTAGNVARGRAWIRRIRGPVLLLLGSTLIALTGLELFVRVFDPLGISYYSEMTRYILDRLPDPEIKYRHRPSFAGTYQGVELRFNEWGLRDDPIGPKPPGEYRILALGDSQTLGWGVEREHIWPVQLQHVLGERLGRPVRVIDSGCASYETRQEFRWLERDGYRVDPDLVLLMYMDNDLEITDDPYDPWGDKAFAGKSPGEIAYLLGRTLRVGQLLFYAKWLVPILYTSRYEPQQFGVRHAFAESMRQESGWKESMAALRGIGDGVRARGLHFAVVHFDWVTFPFSQELSKSVREAVAPFPVAYVPEWFAGQNVRQYFNSTTDAHPNPAGSRIIAEHIAEFLLAQRWIPGGAEAATAR